jgi:putative ABC transport system permease protein
MVNMYLVRASDGAKSATVSAEIDGLFANSRFPTLTQSDRDWIRARVQQVGDVNLIVNLIVFASLFTLLFLTGNVMMQAIRERTPELAVLKVLGYSNPRVLWLVLAEALVLCLPGALVGLIGAMAVFPRLAVAMNAPISMPLSVFAAGLIIGACVALASAVVPVRRALRLSIVDALSRG